MNNFFYLKLIKDIFPNAKIINSRRDILSSIMSIFQKNITELAWAQDLNNLGAGELLVTSIDQDGKATGYDINLLREISTKVNIPIIASGGAGSPEHMYEALSKGNADAVLAASIFHFGEYTINNIKEILYTKGIQDRNE